MGVGVRSGRARNGRSEVLLLDFGGTIDADGVHWSPRFHAGYRGGGGVLAYEEFDPIFQEAHRALESLPQVRSLGYRAMTARLAAELVARLPDGAAIVPELLSDVFCAQALATVERNRPILARLMQTHRLAAVSNFTGNLDPCLEELGLLSCFETTLDSTLLGMAKPDPRIFGEALQRLGADPEQAWMVGDNWNADIRPARKLGMRTCWVAPPGRALPEADGPTARIARLSDLEAVLEAPRTV
jgi:putative hydrolase of the HAD superfamily